MTSQLLVWVFSLAVRESRLKSSHRSCQSCMDSSACERASAEARSRSRASEILARQRALTVAMIRTISEITVLSTEKDITDHTKSRKAETTVAMDFGRITVDETLVMSDGQLDLISDLDAACKLAVDLGAQAGVAPALARGQPDRAVRARARVEVERSERAHADGLHMPRLTLEKLHRAPQRLLGRRRLEAYEPVQPAQPVTYGTHELARACFYAPE